MQPFRIFHFTFRIQTMLSLDLLPYQSQLKVKVEKGKKKIFDPIRKKYYVWQPEEMVRQLLVIYLIEAVGYNKNRIHLERGIQVNGQSKRCDIIVYDEAVQPYLLIEVKAPSISLDQKVLDQIATYNIVYQVPYLLVSNGIQSYCCAMDYEHNTYAFQDSLPSPK